MLGRRVLIRMSLAVAAAVCVVVLICWLMLPSFIHQRAIAALNAAGLRNVDLTVRKVTPWRLELTDLRLGGDSPDRIAGITIDYKPGTLLHSRVGRVHVRGAELFVSLANGSFDLGGLSGVKSSTPATSSTLTLPADGIDLSDSFLSLQLTDQSLRFAASGAIAPQPDGRIQIDLKLAHQDLPLTLSGTIGPRSQDMDLKLSGSGLGANTMTRIASAARAGLTLSGGGKFDLEAKVLRSSANVDASLQLIASDVSLVLGSASLGKKPTNVTGIGGVCEAEAHLENGGPISGMLTLQDATWQSGTASAAGVSGTVHFDDWTHLFTHAAEQIAMARLTIGKLELTDGSIVFAMRGSDKIDVKRTEWKWLRGSVAAENVRVRPPQYSGTLVLRDVDLQSFLTSFMPDTATGTGTISGRVPAFVDWPKVKFGDGTLSAGSSGTLQVKQLAPLSAALDQAGQQSADQLTRKKVIEALGDLDYNALKLQLNNTPGGLSADIRVGGRGRRGFRQAVDVELRVNKGTDSKGLEDLLNYYLGLQQGLSNLGSGG